MVNTYTKHRYYILTITCRLHNTRRSLLVKTVNFRIASIWNVCAGTYSFDCARGETGTKSETTGTVVLSSYSCCREKLSTELVNDRDSYGERRFSLKKKNKNSSALWLDRRLRYVRGRGSKTTERKNCRTSKNKIHDRRRAIYGCCTHRFHWSSDTLYYNIRVGLNSGGLAVLVKSVRNKKNI